MSEISKAYEPQSVESKWYQFWEDQGCFTADPARVMGSTLGDLQDSVGHLAVGGVADVCVLSTEGRWLVGDAALRSQGKSTPFSGYELPGRVMATVVGGQVAFEAA